MSAVLCIVFFFALTLGVPVAITMGGAGLSALMWGGTFSPLLVPQRMFSGIDSFPLMAVPFFILAAELMTGGRITDLLVRFACQLIGNVRGGLGYANVLMAIFFAGISGSALADAAGPGSVIIRMMRQSGYHGEYAAALTASGAIIAPIIPPSIIMIIYALSDTSVSVAGLFLAGIVPGLLLGCALLAVNWWIARKRNYSFGAARPAWGPFLRESWRVFPALMLPIIILGGIHGGIFTPTEASAVAAVYAFLVGRFIFGTLTLGMLPRIFVSTAIMTSAVLLIVSMATVFAYMLTVLQIPQSVSEFIGGLGLSPVMLLIAVSVFLLICGLFLDTLPAVIILVPILAPLAQSVGINPLHFAMVVILNLTIGMITPPVGAVLFVTTVVSKVPMPKLVRALLPMLAAEMAVFVLILLIPGLSTWLPGLFGYTR
ncbi:C4-dicarboxylate ABC transporter [Azospirillum sp. TSH7]|jgi:tripartite ATP-independent transporter DctM subunit|uniref:TRAP transporter large permease n=1 Tax=unclassified Azospirillum TaxID=2630922 RepID=UPI000D613BE6|nr:MULTISPECIES: TRAP transporter large permease [unclassified Azospirillum]PWC55732.1 C4-dicarboxylate ABC transporter [Azospirillum sp. TSH7]PWC65627.1 C4-dicarboxylate ABC transporter [Azospirillum sp. TSH20]